MEYAYVLGLNGAGRRSGVNDSGVIFNTRPLPGTARSPASARCGRRYSNDGQVNPRLPWQYHGTHVAGPWRATAWRTAS